ncbi:DUF805 domain-containing protein [Candidatus Enterococcus ferrettii]|uniref:DUF805 domain-containing protein n=1 Tax=Candidatus Enterococcus ferrettii TaxID=2815324 RepID=A0ABV0EMM3_9ENTE|nr:DUF805 domain-containing protein [Enterococcus sp. 665A]MBO1339175.1 DUF805 domain-containing protein [Enterococcus sp. 665A]
MRKINQKPGQVNFIRALMDYFQGYADFKGHSTRAGYWWVKLVTGFFHLIFFAILFQANIPVMWDAAMLFRYGYLDQRTLNKEILTSLLRVLPIIVFYCLIWLGLFLPSMALLCRRMRDVGLRGRGFAAYYITIVLLLVLQYALHFQKTIIGMSSQGELIIGLCMLLNGCLTLILIVFTLLPTNQLATASNNSAARFFFREKRAKPDNISLEKIAKKKSVKQVEPIKPEESLKKMELEKKVKPKTQFHSAQKKKTAEGSGIRTKKKSGVLVEISRRLEMGRYLNAAFYAIFFCLSAVFLGIGFGGMDDISADICFFVALITYASALLLFLLQLVLNIVGSFRSFQISTEQIVLFCACLGLVSMYIGNATFSLIITLVVLFLDKKTYQMLLKSNITRNFEYTLSFFKLIWITFYGAMYAVGEFHTAIYGFGAKCMSQLYTSPFFADLASNLFPTLCTFVLWPVLLLVLHFVVSVTVQSNKKHTTNRKIDERITLTETNVE